MDKLAPLKSSQSSEWYTPKNLVGEIEAFLGGIDLDPCSPCHGDAAPVPALVHYTKVEDGLLSPWFGRVFLNPPYGRGIGRWVEKSMQGEAGETVLLIPARTDTKWYKKLDPHPRVNIVGRLKFESPGGCTDPAPFPSSLVYVGPVSRYAAFAAAFSHRGKCWGVLCF